MQQDETLQIRMPYGKEEETSVMSFVGDQGYLISF